MYTDICNCGIIIAEYLYIRYNLDVKNTLFIIKCKPFKDGLNKWWEDFVMLCKGCGKEISKESLFCTYCGYKNEPEKADEPSDVEDLPEHSYRPVFQIPPEKFRGAMGPDPRQTSQTPQPQPGPVPPQTNQVPQGQYNQLQQGQWGAGQVPQNQWGPGAAGTSPYFDQNIPGGRKKNKALIIVIVIAVVAVLAIILALASPKLKDIFNKDTEQTSKVRDDKKRDKEYKAEDRIVEEEEDTAVVSLPTPTPVTQDTTVSSGFIPTYSYSEPTNVLSLDSDMRFTFNDYLNEGGVATYQFYYNDAYSSEEEYLNALDNYSYILQQTNDFYYEQEFSEEEYADTGESIVYLSRGNYWLSIVPSYYDSFAYVHIFTINNSMDGSEAGASDFYHYDGYIHGRTEIEYAAYTYITAENGVLFCLNELYSTDTGNGNLEIEVNLDLAGYYYYLFLYDYDFMLLPKDINGYIIADACPIAYIRDEFGNDVPLPLALNADIYENYSLIFYIPDTTEYITLYATNTLNESAAGDLYAIEYKIN